MPLHMRSTVPFISKLGKVGGLLLEEAGVLAAALKFSALPAVKQ